MRKIFITFNILLIMFFFAVRRVVAVDGPNGAESAPLIYDSSYYTEYYNNIKGMTGTDLLKGLANISFENHKYYNTYGETRGGLSITDADPKDSTKVLDFYSGVSLSNIWTGQTSDWNREHLWCQSNSGLLYENTDNSTRGAGADIHHIRVLDGNFNSTRNNNLYAEFDDLEGVSKTEYVLKGVNTGCYYGGIYFEPRDAVKGDIARILMYLYMHYSNENNLNTHQYSGNLLITNIVYTSNKTNQDAWDLLCDWNELDPVDSIEANRHNKCIEMTGVRNPFIDHSEFADMIWDSSYIGEGAILDKSNTNSGENAGTIGSKECAKLINNYYNNGVYTKKTNIYLNEAAQEELIKYFHGPVAQERTTYYNGNYLLMGNFDGSVAKVDSDNNPIEGINSGYRTDGSDMKHFIYKDGSVIDTYTVNNTNIDSFYVTLNKMNKSGYFDSSWIKGGHNVENSNDKFLKDFLAFTAPCLKENVLSNYITSTGMKLTISEEEHPLLGTYLSLKMIVSSLDSSKVGSDLVLSEARIYKGNASFDESFRGYKIEIDSNIENGTVVSSCAVADNNEKVTLTVTPDANYKLVALYVNGIEVSVVDNKYSFNALSDTAVTAVFEMISDKYTVGFESGEGFPSKTSYQGTVTAGNDRTWTTYYGNFSTTDAISDSQSAQMRWYTKTPSNIGYLKMNFDLKNVNKLSFKYKTTGGLQLKLSYSTDGGATWVDYSTYQSKSTSTNVNVTFNQPFESVRFKFEILLPSSHPSSTSRLTVDSIVIE